MTDQQRPPAYTLPTYTEVWRVERELTHLYGWDFPGPVKVRQLLVFGVLFAPWYLLLAYVLRVPFEPGWMILYLFPPVVGAHYYIQPVAAGMRPHEYLWTQATYLAEPRELDGLGPVVREPDQVSVAAVVWQPDMAVQAAAEQLRTSLELSTAGNQPRRRRGRAARRAENDQLPDARERARHAADRADRVAARGDLSGGILDSPPRGLNRVIPTGRRRAARAQAVKRHGQSAMRSGQPAAWRRMRRAGAQVQRLLLAAGLLERPRGAHEPTRRRR